MSMRMKRAVFLAAGMAAAVASSVFAAETEAEVKMTPGTYTGVAEGHNGAVKVNVTVTEDRITDIEVGDNYETAGLATPALEEIPAKMLENQTTAVDVVSGATYTTVALMGAVRDALTQAGAPEDSFRTKVEHEPEADAEYDADVAIVGGGGAGMSAALRLTELGKSVVLIEKTSSLGGTIRVSGGNQVVQGSKAQQEAGVTDDSAESMEADFMANGDNLNDEELLSIYAENVGQTTDWLVDTIGVKYNMDGGLHKLAEYSIDRELAYDGGGAGAAKILADQVDASGANVLLNTTAKSLIVEDGKVTGVEATARFGGKVTVHAGAVILATGGYGNNNDLLPETAEEGLFYGLDSSAGQGLLMAQEAVNAGTTHMEYIKEYPNGVETSPKHAKSTIAGNIGAFAESAILVNKAGDRVVNEKASNHDILRALQEQEGETLYLVMDSEVFNEWKTKLQAAGLTEETIDKYVENNGASEPVFTHGDTVAEAADAAGIDGEELQKTVDRYNGFVDAGEDADFGRGADYLKVKIGDGPYYIVEQKARYATTMGGLDVNDDLQVVDADGNPVEGLYAAGEVIGGQMGDDSPSGANNGWALTSGKYVADVLAGGNE